MFGSLYNELARRLYSPNNYVIRRRDSADWYFKYYEKTICEKVIWVPSIQKAKIFVTEQDVEEFKLAFLKGRPCDIILIEKA